MLDISELLNKKKIAEKCARYLESVNHSEAKFHRGYAQALREIISELSPLTLVQNDIANESEFQVAIITTPANSIATSVAVLNQDGELGMAYTRKSFRKCDKCNRKQYKVYTDSGVWSCWMDLN